MAAGSEAAFTHLKPSGEAHMVDVGQKPTTHRFAVARARISLDPKVLVEIDRSELPKGDVWAAARFGAISAAKKTSDLIPLCHPIALTGIDVRFASNASTGEVEVIVRVDAVDRTGVEMEAMTAASTAALVIYDMCKSRDRWMRVTEVALLEKGGGKSGHVERPDP